MKKLFRYITFWFVVASILVIIQHKMGGDSKSILLIGFNPILNEFARIKVLHTFMDSGLMISCKTIGPAGGKISIYWYLGSLITMAIYGYVLDLCKYLIVKLLHKRTK